MLATATIHEEITEKIIEAIEDGQTPPWRRPWRPDLENSGYPCNILSMPFTGVNTILLNLAVTGPGFNSKFWTTEAAWELIGGRVSGEGTLIVSTLDPNRWLKVHNADQVAGGETGHFHCCRRSMPVAVDYGPAEVILAACRKNGADIRQRLTQEAAYYYPPNDYIVFPLKEQFLNGPGGLPGYYDSLLHELAHFSEPRLGWNGIPIVRELRAEIASAFITARLGVGVLSDTKMLTNHRNHLARWVRAMKNDPSLIVNVAADASAAVDYLLSLKG